MPPVIESNGCVSICRILGHDKPILLQEWDVDKEKASAFIIEAQGFG